MTRCIMARPEIQADSDLDLIQVTASCAGNIFLKLGSGNVLPQDSHPFPAVSKQSRRTDGPSWLGLKFLLLLLKAMWVTYCKCVTQAPCTVGQECPNLVLSAFPFIRSLFSCPKRLQCRKESGWQAVGTGNAGQPGLPENTEEKLFHFSLVGETRVQFCSHPNLTPNQEV